MKYTDSELIEASGSLPRYIVELDGGTTWTASLCPFNTLDSRTFEELRREYADTLDELKETAKTSDGSVWLSSVDNEAWEVLPVAEDTQNIHYGWTLCKEGLHVSIHRNPCDSIPGVRCVIKARALRRFSLRQIDGLVSNLLAVFGLRFIGQTYSRLDVNLTTNLSKWDIRTISSKVNRGHMVNKFHKLTRDGNGVCDCKVITWGKYPNTEFQIYDKSSELNKLMSSKDLEKSLNASEKYVYLVQRLGSVGLWTRYEWRLSRRDLKKHDINTTEDIEKKLSGCVKFCFEQKLRLTDRKPNRQNTSREKNWEPWDELVEAFVQGVADYFGTEHNKHYKPLSHNEIKEIVKTSAPRSRCVSTISAYFSKILSIEGIEQTTVEEVQRYIEENSRELAVAIAGKHNERFTQPEAVKRLVKERNAREFIEKLEPFAEFSDWESEQFGLLGLPVAEAEAEAGFVCPSAEGQRVESSSNTATPSPSRLGACVDCARSPLPAPSSPFVSEGGGGVGRGEHLPPFGVGGAQKPFTIVNTNPTGARARKASGGTKRHVLEPRTPSAETFRQTPPNVSRKSLRALFEEAYEGGEGGVDNFQPVEYTINWS